MIRVERIFLTLAVVGVVVALLAAFAPSPLPSLPRGSASPPLAREARLERREVTLQPIALNWYQASLPEPKPEIPTPEEIVPLTPPELPPLEGVQLVGVVLTPKHQQAIVRVAGQSEPLRLGLGDTHAGWTLSRLEAARIEFEADGRRQTLFLWPGASVEQKD